ncbi:MAG TPA: EAL domain-containing response regulator [Burkholderiales bacterium]|nr:EAL domain-containing response regulator [Burkholderiales bacterium]
MNIQQLNILVVEDDEFERGMITHSLRSMGIVLLHAVADGKQALDELRQAAAPPYHIVICDLNMPEMDGLEFLRRLSQEQIDVAVIIISALGNKLLISAERMAKMYGINLLGRVEKPLLPERLRKLLNQFSHFSSPNNNTADKHYALTEILEALEAHQFSAFFQPKLDLMTGRLIGAEALARWLHPDDGIIGPYAFIPALEQNNCIETLTLFMLAQSIELYSLLHEIGIDISVSINIAPVLLDNVSLPNKIWQQVMHAAIDPRCFILEITESAAVSNNAHAMESLARLCMYGFPLSIDDFGTGYSNIQQLTRIAFSELKIDQSFIGDFLDNESQNIAITSSLELARKLKLTTVAEGVETEQQWEALKALGCDAAQGFLIARPMDQKEFFRYAQTIDKH